MRLWVFHDDRNRRRISRLTQYIFSVFLQLFSPITLFWLQMKTNLMDNVQTSKIYKCFRLDAVNDFLLLSSAEAHGFCFRLEVCSVFQAGEKIQIILTEIF